MAAVKRVVGVVVAIVVLILTFGAGWVVARFGLGPSIDPALLPERERNFVERMQNTSMVGVFTLTGRESRSGAPDRYDITSVEKISEGRWRFNMRMRHSTVDVTLPVTVPLEWVGDTPTIVMKDFSIPTLGTFSALVFFDGDRYAGTWQHGQYGGHMYGAIEKQK